MSAIKEPTVGAGERKDTFPFALEACPRCGYSLTGLPDSHDCPECGFFFDRNSQVVRCPRHPIRTNLPGVMYGCGLLVLLYKWPQPGFFILAAVFAILFVWRLHASLQPSFMIIVSRTRVRIIDREGKERVHSVESMGKAHWSFVTGWFTLRAQNNLLLDEFQGALLGSNKQARQAVRLINEAIRLRDEAET